MAASLLWKKYALSGVNNISPLTKMTSLSLYVLFCICLSCSHLMLFGHFCFQFKRITKRVQSNQPAPADASGSSGGEVKPFRFSPFQVSPANKVDYALARMDDLMNFIRRV